MANWGSESDRKRERDHTDDVANFAMEGLTTQKLSPQTTLSHLGAWSLLLRMIVFYCLE